MRGALPSLVPLQLLLPRGWVVPELAPQQLQQRGLLPRLLWGASGSAQHLRLLP
jgi:hypothetical protein